LQFAALVLRALVWLDAFVYLDTQLFCLLLVGFLGKRERRMTALLHALLQVLKISSELLQVCSLGILLQ
jgi:hypothetical protein